jgi:integrase
MASAHKRENGRWRAMWRDGAGKQRTKDGFISKTAAENYAWGEEDKSRRTKDEVASELTWGEWKTEWLAKRKVEPSTAGVDAYNIKSHLEPRWNDVVLATITTADVQEWVDELAERYAPATVAKIVVSTFSPSLTEAARRGKGVKINPVIGIELPKPGPKRKRYLTRSQVDTLLGLLKTPYREVVLVLVTTGMRIGELQGLHRADVHLAERFITVKNVWMPGPDLIKEYPKNRSWRTVPIQEWAVPTIQALLDLPETGRCGQTHKDMKKGERCSSGLLISGVEGGVLDRHNFRSRAWATALEAAAKVDPSIGAPVLHDLRHTFASWFVQDGGSKEDLAVIMGHRYVTVTELYADLDTSHVHRARKVLNRARRAPKPTLRAVGE